MFALAQRLIFLNTNNQITQETSSDIKMTLPILISFKELIKMRKFESQMFETLCLLLKSFENTNAHTLNVSGIAQKNNASLF